MHIWKSGFDQLLRREPEPAVREATPVVPTRETLKKDFRRLQSVRHLRLLKLAS